MPVRRRPMLLALLALLASGPGASAGRAGLGIGPAAVGPLGAPVSPHRLAAQSPTEAYRLDAVWTSQTGDIPPAAMREPWGIEVDPFDGRVVVADSANDRVQVFEPDGSFVRSLAGAPGTPAALDNPTDVEVQGSLVFVSDTGHDRVALFTIDDGVYAGEWTGLAAPWGLAATEDGRVFVVESGTSQVVVFRADGARLGAWPVASTALRGAEATARGQVALVDAGTRQVRIFDASGVEQRTSAELPGTPADVAVDPGGDLYVTIEELGVIRLADQFDLPEIGRLSLPGARGIAAGPAPDLAIYATFQDDLRPLHGVQRWVGRPLREDALWGAVPAPLGVFDEPYRIASGPLTLVADAWRRVQRFDATGAVVDQVAAGSVNDVAAGPGDAILVARDGDVTRIAADGSIDWSWLVPVSARQYAWVVALDYVPTTDRIAAIDIGQQWLWVLDSQGALIERHPLSAGGTTTPLWDVARAPAGHYAVNRRANTIETRTNQGAVRASWPVPGGPLRVASDGSGNAFVLNRYGWVWKYSADGSLSAVWRAGDPAAPESRPADLAVDEAGRVLVVDRALARVEVYAPDPGGVPGEVPSFEPTCAAAGDKTADPTLLTLDEETTVSLRVEGSCGAAESRADIVLVMDVSGSMTELAAGSPLSKMDAAKQAAVTFLGLIDFGPNRVGVVAFNSAAQLVSRLSDDIVAPRNAILALTAGGGTDIAAGAEAARAELEGPRARTDANAVIVLMTDGFSDPITAQRAADRAKLEGIRFFTIGFGQQVNEALLAAMATAPSDYYAAPTAADLETIYTAIARRISAAVLFRTLTVIDELPANMVFVVGSGNPEPDVAGQVLVWRLTDVPMTGLTLSFRVRPLETGRWPTNTYALGEGTDGLGQPGRVAFPVPEVEVVAPSGTPPLTLTPSLTPTPTDTPTPRPTPRPRPIYLPIAFKQLCVARRQHADVVLVLDTSDSMLGTAGGGRSKLDAAVAAARAFLDLLDMRQAPQPGDAAGVVTFNDSASVRIGLTRNREAAQAALLGLPQGPGTRIDRGLDAAATTLSGPGRTEANLPVVVLLTDGIPTGASAEDVRQAAARLRDLGVLIYSVGLGPDVDPLLLADVAGDPARLLLAPTSDDLAAVYAAVARELPCAAPPVNWMTR